MEQPIRSSLQRNVGLSSSFHQQLHLSAILNNVGRLLYNREEHVAAMDHYKESVRIRIATLNSKVEVEQDAGAKLAEMSRFQASLKDSEQVNTAPPMACDAMCQVGVECFSMDALTIDSRSYPDLVHDGSDVTGDESFKTIYNMGLVHLAKGSPEPAKQLFEMSLSLMTSRDDYLSVGILCHHHIGVYHFMERRYDEAFTSFCEALQGGRIQLQKLEESHEKHALYSSFVAKTLRCVAMCQIQNQEPVHAMESCKEALCMLREIFPSDGIDVATTMNVLGTIHQAMGDVQEARNHYETFIRRATLELGEHHPRLASSMHSLGTVHFDEGNLNEAMSCFNSALQIRISCLGEQHADVARTLFGIAQVYHEQQDYVDALNVYKKTFYIQSLVLGEEDPEVISTLCNLGLVFHLRGDLDEALKIHQHALELSLKVLGVHPLVGFILKTVGNIYLELGQEQAANVFLERSRNINKSLEIRDAEDDCSSMVAVMLSTNRNRQNHAAAA